ncbi:glutamyl-tRNA and/or aspartyl-tRNA(Asn) amidotransferase, A subunit [Streptomyces sp. SPB074]|nr:glutamyl-tRNA and/or aspartyl-tRNA(Asn) amidotransferase, A subunit [Streptomyces sp. SPB074]
MTTPAADALCALSATELSALVRDREVSPVEVVDAVLERMAATEPELHAFCTPAPEQARASARVLAGRLARGGAAGPLAGVPLGVKDLLSTRGCAPPRVRSPTGTSCPKRTTSSWSGCARRTPSCSARPTRAS